MKRVFVAGASGMLGSTLVPVLSAAGYEVQANGSSEPRADLTDRAAAANVLDAYQPDAIVNLVALTNVDECERDPARAYDLNARVVENLARWAADAPVRCHLVQVSTDQVYSGAGPHLEEGVRPVNYYAYSKHAGELLAALAGATVLRTNLFGRSRRAGRVSLSDWLVGVLRRAEAAPVFDDVLFTPLSLETLSRCIAAAVDRRLPGTFNLGSRNGMSKAAFAFALGRALGLPTDKLKVTTMSAGGLLARRPLDMRMDCTRFESAFGQVLPTLESEIQLMRNSYADQA